MNKEGFGKLKSLDEAKKIIKNLLKKTESEEINLNEGLDRILFEDLKSPINVPNFEKSAMDGFAVIAENTFGATNTNPKEFEIIDEITAGMLSSKEIKNNQCIKITTGSPLPKGANAVMMVENTQEKNNKVNIYKAIAPHENVVKIGSDIKQNDIILKAKTKLDARKLGVISAIGKTKIKVAKKPIIAYFSTGNEIVAPGQNLPKGKVYDINTTTITNAIKEQNCELINLGVVEDDLQKIKNTIKKGIEKSDFLLLSGGSSLGGEDFMVEAVKELGEVLVHGIAVKPGKPVLVGKVYDKLVLGLPGYPTSALSNFYILVKPIIHDLLEIKDEQKTIIRKISRKIVSTIGRYQFLAVSTDDEFAYPILKGSSSITTLTESNGFVEIDENTEILQEEEEVEVKLF